MAKKKEAKKKELKVVNEEVINGAKIITYEDGSVDIIPAVIHLTAEQASDLFNSDEDDDFVYCGRKFKMEEIKVGVAEE